MQRLTTQGQEIVTDLAQRYGVSNDAVMCMLDALINGNGTMAQFNHPDFGGSGQWMQGGMTMVGDMFNYGLKSKVEGLCSELSALIANQQHELFKPASSQSQSQFQGGQQQGGGYGQVSLFVPGGTGNANWWPADLGLASSTGAQNNIRYAYFPSSCRLAVEINGHVTVYDTQDHQIGGVSQQQGNDASLTFTSQYGLVWVENLPIISIDGVDYQAPVEAVEPVVPEKTNELNPPEINTQQAVEQSVPFNADSNSNNVSTVDIISMIEQLAELRKKDILTEEEFSDKKAELLKKIC